MPTVLLVRHGRTAANAGGLLAGRGEGVGLDDTGVAQAATLPARLEALPLAVAVHSPLQRCRETLEPLAAARPDLSVVEDERIVECDYGEWTGRSLADLAREPLMEVVQRHPSAARFPGGESMPEMATRAAAAVRDWAGRVEDEHGPDALWLMCSHGDVIKSMVADALGLHLDLFQRISVGPASVTVIRWTRERPFLLRLGDTGDLSGLTAGPGPGAGSGGAAAVGGGAT
ncbi:histidine phosphatase family protein [Streptomyces sp. ST2-7A]|uniref:histidine phosphatase family protein n=1 Tax=Streptomyces sp. ST2-7A TaxID=2907214 RepID=UPI001F33969A|nr:histidine phosphatase family protein [Streptomyces sp. ST2-7A]MCE7083263.1 MSMEG_4193 family putative phosphomutase [Streptomyces sp. ST2-7A]